MNRYVVALLASALLLSGCDAVSTLQDGLAQSQAVADDLEKEVGSKPYVGFNWNNGSLTAVTVNFEGIPGNKPVAEIADLARSSIKKQFKQEPLQIVLGFSIKP